MEQLIKNLKALRGVKPSQDFAHRSKSVILASSKPNHHLASLKIRFWEGALYTGALTLASVLIFVAVAGVSYFNIKNLAPAVLTGLDDAKLLSEAGATDFQIRLNEIKYYEESAKEVTALLNAVSQQEN